MTSNRPYFLLDKVQLLSAPDLDPLPLAFVAIGACSEVTWGEGDRPQLHLTNGRVYRLTSRTTKRSALHLAGTFPSFQARSSGYVHPTGSQPWVARYISATMALIAPIAAGTSSALLA
jgi:hypothetical protein